MSGRAGKIARKNGRLRRWRCVTKLIRELLVVHKKMESTISINTLANLSPSNSSSTSNDSGGFLMKLVQKYNGNTHIYFKPEYVSLFAKV
ncbi:hypothetical protein EJB05_28297, partial [Eragrostis curvula]